MKNKSFLLISISLVIVLSLLSCSQKEKKILVFSKTAGFRHESIEAGIEAIKKLGTEHQFKVVATEDSNYFTEDSLKLYSAVIFLNTTGDILNDVEQANFERYIQAGGGFLGVHAATDTEYDWPWYNKLVGAYFKGHPHIQEAKLNIVDPNNETTKHLKNPWIRTDEWYNFRDINPDINVLISIDEKSYEGGDNGENHPMTWYHEYDGGRSYYIEMGHTNESYVEPEYLQLLLNGINYAIGKNTLNYKLAKSERIVPGDRFSREILDYNLYEPMALREIPGKGILFIERRGAIKFYDFNEQKTNTITHLDVFDENEDGLLGLELDPNFEKNNWIYLFYSTPGELPQNQVSRFTLKNNTLDLASEKILLVIPTIRKCCHSGGYLKFGADGNLYIGLGDNTNPFESAGFAPIDERPDRALWDAQKSAANTNDLRGKILRIKPNDDGTYAIPDGNLFPVGTNNTRPEIYTMGLRNPFRFSIDSKTHYLYWGDVGPDAGKDISNRGPKGMGEFNQARKAGNFGWPYTRGNNQVYNDFNFETSTPGAKFDPNHLVNDSPNNTGLKNLPPATKSLIWYSYDASKEFPWLGTGGVNPMAGPVFHKQDIPKAKVTFPSYFENKLFLYEWMRDWIYIVKLDENQNYVKADRFMPESSFSHPMDMIFGTDGSLYVLEYGQKWYGKNLDARLNKISYIEGNRPPIAKITADKIVGSTPLTVAFSSADSKDYDHDKLKYEWMFTDTTVQSTEANPSFTFNTPGSYTVRLKVSDSNGTSSIAQTKILAGNDVPEINITYDTNDFTYTKNKKVKYAITVTDKQDGSTADKTIPASDVKVTFEYVPQGKDMVTAVIGHQKNVKAEGLALIEASDCKACHAVNEKVNGPSYIDIAKKYTFNDKAYLVDKIIKGGSGVWGESMMSAHPQLAPNEVEKIVNYILNLKPVDESNIKLLPLSGTLDFNKHNAKDDGKGVYILTVSYHDKGIKAGDTESELSETKQTIFEPSKVVEK